MLSGSGVGRRVGDVYCFVWKRSLNDWPVWRVEHGPALAVLGALERPVLRVATGASFAEVSA
jgi:hypothetical protein